MHCTELEFWGYAKVPHGVYLGWTVCDQDISLALQRLQRFPTDAALISLFRSGILCSVEGCRDSGSWSCSRSKTDTWITRKKCIKSGWNTLSMSPFISDKPTHGAAGDGSLPTLHRRNFVFRVLWDRRCRRHNFRSILFSWTSAANASLLSLIHQLLIRPLFIHYRPRAWLSHRTSNRESRQVSTFCTRELQISSLKPLIAPFASAQGVTSPPKTHNCFQETGLLCNAFWSARLLLFNQRTKTSHLTFLTGEKRICYRFAGALRREPSPNRHHTGLATRHDQSIRPSQFSSSLHNLVKFVACYYTAFHTSHQHRPQTLFPPFPHPLKIPCCALLFQCLFSIYSLLLSPLPPPASLFAFHRKFKKRLSTLSCTTEGRAQRELLAKHESQGNDTQPRALEGLLATSDSQVERKCFRRSQTSRWKFIQRCQERKEQFTWFPDDHFHSFFLFLLLNLLSSSAS